MALDSKIEELFRKAVNYVEDVKTTFGSTGDEVSGELFRIGRPINFPNQVDPGHRVSRYIRSKMNIIDLVPCDFEINFSKKGDPVNKDNITDLSGLIPTVTYNKAVARYKQDLKNYGLGIGDETLPNIIGLRLYTTDDSTSNDQISNDYGDNVLMSALEKMSQMGTSFRQLAESVGEGGKEAIKGLGGYASDKTVDVTESVSALLGASENTTERAKQLAGQVSKIASDIILQGHRVQLPQIWNNSSYNPSFNVTLKLVSPYGHPNAIKEFIVRPLMHLLILCTPVTYDGASYGRPQTLSIQGYGTNYTPLGVIRSINLRRGGNDSSFNIFRQPLSIDVSLDFQFLVNGIAHFDGTSSIDNLNYDKGVFGDIHKTIQRTGQVFRGKATIQTVGKLIESLRPIDPEEKEDFIDQPDKAETAKTSTTSNTPDQAETKAVEGRAKDSNAQIDASMTIPYGSNDDTDTQFV